MPTISPELDHLTVINLFGTDTAHNQDRLLGAMREIVDSAAFPGWISSTVHSGQRRFGTANFIQWRSGDDLEARYQGKEFKHHTLPLFSEITTSLKLLQTRVAFTHRCPALGATTEISTERDDCTVIEVLEVSPETQDDLIAVLEQASGWLPELPGYRSYSVLRGLRARGVGHGAQVTLTQSGPPERGFVVVYSQWADQQSYEAFRAAGIPQAGWEQLQGRLESLVTSTEWNTYRVVHTRSSGQQ